MISIDTNQLRINPTSFSSRRGANRHKRIFSKIQSQILPIPIDINRGLQLGRKHILEILGANSSLYTEVLKQISTYHLRFERVTDLSNLDNPFPVLCSLIGQNANLVFHVPALNGEIPHTAKLKKITTEPLTLVNGDLIIFVNRPKLISNGQDSFSKVLQILFDLDGFVGSHFLQFDGNSNTLHPIPIYSVVKPENVKIVNADVTKVGRNSTYNLPPQMSKEHLLIRLGSSGGLEVALSPKATNRDIAWLIDKSSLWGIKIQDQFLPFSIGSVIEFRFNDPKGVLTIHTFVLSPLMNGEGRYYLTTLGQEKVGKITRGLTFINSNRPLRTRSSINGTNS